ncbi:MAG: GDSL-type esterase/lipase family protein [Ignavibacteriaceae bacterium]
MSWKSTSNYISFNKYFRSLNQLLQTLPVLIMALLTFSLFSFCFAKPQGTSAASEKWVGTWSTAPQLVETSNNPPSPGLSNNTLRQIVHVSIGGDSLRIRFSNEFSKSSVTLTSVHIAVSKGNGIIDTTTDKTIFFNGKLDVTMAPGTAVTSDSFLFALQPLTNVAITIYFGNTSPDVTGHPGSRTTSYLLTGNEVSKADFTGAITTDHWYIINTIDVLAPDSAYAVDILGDSITDGRGSGTNKQDRWPDELARRFQANPETRHVAVLNEGIGGNCVLGTCLGPSALSRFGRDVLNQNGVKWVIILEGINDIGNAWNSTQVAQNLIAAFGQMIDSAHARGLLVYGATLLPFGGSFYDSPDHQKAWQTVNDWIRNSGRFDAVIDLDSAMQNPSKPSEILPRYDSGDHLHPNETGHHMMAEAVDSTLFGAAYTTPTIIDEKSDNQPHTFSLLQNYPNPFNPATTISYQLPKTSHVTLKAYDVLGREMAVLVDEQKNAGTYQVTLNGTRLTSGVYLYQLKAGNFVETKKLILLK